MASDTNRITPSRNLEAVLHELLTISELKPGQKLAISKLDHNFVIINRSGKTSVSVYENPEKLNERLDDIRILVSEILSPEAPLSPGHLKILSLTIFKAIEALRLNDANSPILQKIVSVKDKVFSETTIKFHIPCSKSLPENLSEILKIPIPQELLANNLLPEKKEDSDHTSAQLDPFSKERSTSCALITIEENVPSPSPVLLSQRPAYVKKTMLLKKSPSSPDLHTLHIDGQVREKTPPPSCASVPLSDGKITPDVEKSAASPGIYYTKAFPRSCSCVNQWVTEYNHPSKEEKYRAVLTSLAQSFQEACSQEIFEKNISILEILKTLQPNIESFQICKLTHQLLNILIYFDKPDSDCRMQYSDLNSKLREILYFISSPDFTSSVKNPPVDLCLKLINTLCYVKYTGVQIYPFLQNIVGLFTNYSCAAIPLEAPLSSEDLPATLWHDNDQIRTAPIELQKPEWARTTQKMSGAFNVYFDPAKVINTPYLRSIQTYITKPRRKDSSPEENESSCCSSTASSKDEELSPPAAKQVLYLRHGTPTCEYWLTCSALATASRFLSNWSWGVIPPYHNATIIPEYEAFISRAHQKGDMILYCNHQKMEQATINDESDRCAAIKSLESTHPNFHFLSLPMGDGPLFKESSEIGIIKNAVEFKTKFIEAYMKDLHGVSIPISCKDENLLPELEKIFSDVHRLYFGNQEELSHHDKTVFTLAFNAYLKEYIKFHAYEKMLLNAQVDEKQKVMKGKIITVSACKDNIDRGGTSTTLDEFLNLVILGQENNPERIKELRVNHAAPAIIVKKQNVIPERQLLVELFITHFNSLSTPQKDAIRSYFPYTWKLVDHHIAR